MKALEFLAIDEQVKLIDLKLEKKILSKLFKELPYIKSFNIDLYKDPITGEHTLIDSFTLDKDVEDIFIKIHHTITRKVSSDIVKIRGLEFAKLLEKDLSGIQIGEDRIAYLKKIESRIRRIIISLVDDETHDDWELRKFGFIQDKFYDVISYLEDIEFSENKYVLSYNLPGRFVIVMDEAFELFVNAGLLAKNSKVAFESVLLLQNKTKQLDWLGKQNVFVYFIKAITHEDNKIIHCKGDKWEIATNCFTVNGKKIAKSIQHDNPPKDNNPAKIVVDQVIKLFKKSKKNNTVF
jgi:hypothetical protein